MEGGRSNGPTENPIDFGVGEIVDMLSGYMSSDNERNGEVAEIENPSIAIGKPDPFNDPFCEDFTCATDEEIENEQEGPEGERVTYI